MIKAVKQLVSPVEDIFYNNRFNEFGTKLECSVLLDIFFYNPKIYIIAGMVYMERPWFTWTKWHKHIRMRTSETKCCFSVIYRYKKAVKNEFRKINDEIIIIERGWSNKLTLSYFISVSFITYFITFNSFCDYWHPTMKS